MTTKKRTTAKKQQSADPWVNHIKRGVNTVKKITDVIRIAMPGGVRKEYNKINRELKRVVRSK